MRNQESDAQEDRKKLKPTAISEMLGAKAGYDSCTEHHQDGQTTQATPQAPTDQCAPTLTH